MLSKKKKFFQSHLQPGIFFSVTISKMKTIKLMRQTLILIPVLLCLKISSADNQSLTQILRGKIVDKDSGLPIIGANLVINDLSPMVGTSTNSEGEFQFQPLRVGRYDITVQCIGYEPKVVSNILLKAGKESELTIFLTESVVNIEEGSGNTWEYRDSIAPGEYRLEGKKINDPYMGT